MTTLLEKAVAKASALPEQQQDALAQILLDEMEDEARWDASVCAVAGYAGGNGR